MNPMVPVFVVVLSLTIWTGSDAFGGTSLPCPRSFIWNGITPRGTSTVTVTGMPTTTTLYRQPDKWDLILDDLDNDNDNDTIQDKDEDGRGGLKGPSYLPHPPDMAYEPRIVQRAHQTFHAIRAAGGKETTNDVYVRDPVDKEVFWYTGKVAKISDVSLEDCIQRLYPMIERHACHLRPKELYPHRGTLQVWTAPGDSELEVAYNRPTIRLQPFLHSKEWHYNPNKSSTRASKYPLHIKASAVGFQGEVYQDGEDGFRTWRNDDGMPARPELDPGGETRPPTAQELETIQRDYSALGGDSDGIVDAVVTNQTKDGNLT
jgi:hypothetical protein